MPQKKPFPLSVLITLYPFKPCINACFLPLGEHKISLYQLVILLPLTKRCIVSKTYLETIQGAFS